MAEVLDEAMEVLDIKAIQWRELDRESLESALTSVQEVLERIQKAQDVRQETLACEISV